MNVAARSRMNEKKESARVRREEKKKSHLALHLFLKHFHAYKDDSSFFFLFNWLSSLSLRTWESFFAKSFLWLRSELFEITRWKALLQAQNQHLDFFHNTFTEIKLLTWEYYNQQFEKIDIKYQFISLYADTINLHINYIERLWRESIIFNVHSVMILLTLSTL